MGKEEKVPMLRRKRFNHLAKIRVVGVGNGGITAVNAMVEAGVNSVDYVTVDDSERDLQKTRAEVSIHVAAGDPCRLLRRALAGSDMVFIVGGLGGETGTRLAPMVAAAAREHDALTTAIVTVPFSFEGGRRAQHAQQGIQLLRKHVNTLIAIPNDRLLEMAGGALAFHQTYDLALNIWRESVQGITELVNSPGLVNVDFADVRTVMDVGGPSIIATGIGYGPAGARLAAEQATNSPFLDVTIDGARSVLFNITGGPSLTLQEVRQAAAVIRRRVHPDANIIFGAAVDATLDDEIRMTVIATGCGFSASQLGMTAVRSNDLGRITAEAFTTNPVPVA